MFARKGGSLHRRAGWVFVAGMAVVAISAVVLASGRLFLDPRPEARQGGMFLLYIAVLTSAAVSSGVRVLRTKQRVAAHRHWWDLGLPALLTVSSLGVAAFGIVNRQPLFAAFSAIGLLNGVCSLRYWLRPPSTRMHWWFGHMNGMLGGCIAAVTAFFVVNASNLGVAPLIAWLSPSVIGSIGTAIWTRYYRRQFSARDAHASSVPRVSGIPDHAMAASTNAIEAVANAAPNPRVCASEPTANGATALAMRPML